jgi:hypothetical protein
VGGLTFGLTRIFGDGSTGPVIVSAALVLALGAGFFQRLSQGRTLTAEA